jgi:alkylation response protein AidB-like acyl-CoA dehydrogenase
MWSAEVPLARYGTPEQKARWLPGLADGSVIGVQAMTETETGSDAMALSTTATRDDDGYVLSGSKIFITNAPVADMFVVFATIDRSKGWAGVSAFAVDRRLPGIELGVPQDKMGLRTSPMSEVHFVDCRVPHDAVLGKPGGGLAIFNHSMDWERSLILATAVGSMQRQLDQCIAYARERRQFGKPIGKFQAVSHRIVNMKLRLKGARLALYHLAWLKSQGKATPSESAEVKLAISEAYVESSLDAISVHGGYGYMTELELERELRDAVASRIYSGTSDVLRNVVASRMGL